MNCESPGPACHTGTRETPTGDGGGDVDGWWGREKTSGERDRRVSRDRAGAVLAGGE